MELRWETASEIVVSGFQMLRSATGRREQAVVISEVILASGDGTPEAYSPVSVPPPGTATLSPRVFLPVVRR